MSKIQDYQISSFKTFRGHDGNGFNATLSRNGKKVALVDDDGWGGGFTYSWLDIKDGREEQEVLDYQGKPFMRRMTKEEAMFHNAIKDLTYICPFDGKVARHNEDTIIDGLIEDYELTKKAKKCTLIKLKSKGDNWLIIKAPYTPELSERIVAKYGDDLTTIYNRDGRG